MDRGHPVAGIVENHARKQRPRPEPPAALVLAALAAVWSNLPLRRPKKAGPFHRVPVISRAVRGRLR
jgi:hypothetical protein